jgi:hypothetical protein
VCLIADLGRAGVNIDMDEYNERREDERDEKKDVDPMI